jgi:hypothetical protein
VDALRGRGSSRLLIGFSWMGSSYEFMDTTISVARDWSAGGIKRLAGSRK